MPVDDHDEWVVSSTSSPSAQSSALPFPLATLNCGESTREDHNEQLDLDGGGLDRETELSSVSEAMVVPEPVSVRLPTLSLNRTSMEPQPSNSSAEDWQGNPSGTKLSTMKLHSAKRIDIPRFDRYIYAQEGARSPPPTIDTIPTLPKTADTAPVVGKQDEPLYLPIDPRTHWPQPHSASWHFTKQLEIQARGGRKANFGRATHSLRRQLKIQEEQDRERWEKTMLPEKILENPAWVRALERLGRLGGGRGGREEA